MSTDTEHFQALADNLIQTLGCDRAVHVANQFGWYGVADEIVRRQSRDAKRHDFERIAQTA